MNAYEKWLNTQDFRPGHNPEHAAPVPAQPAAVPEAVAKDAEREVRIKLMVATELLKRAEPFTLCSHSDLNREIYVFLNHALLSAADTEVKK